MIRKRKLVTLTTWYFGCRAGHFECWLALCALALYTMHPWRKLPAVTITCIRELMDCHHLCERVFLQGLEKCLSPSNDWISHSSQPWKHPSQSGILLHAFLLLLATLQTHYLCFSLNRRPLLLWKNVCLLIPVRAPDIYHRLDIIHPSWLLLWWRGAFGQPPKVFWRHKFSLASRRNMRRISSGDYGQHCVYWRNVIIPYNVQLTLLRHE